MRVPVGAHGSPRNIPLHPFVKILVVDDEASIRTVLALLLRDDGHEVAVAQDGIEALREMENAQFDVVMTDRAMPRMDGHELAREIRQRYPAVHTILVSGSTYGKISHENCPPEFDAFVPKPFTRDLLRAGMANAAAARDAGNQA